MTRIRLNLHVEGEISKLPHNDRMKALELIHTADMLKEFYPVVPIAVVDQDEKDKTVYHLSRLVLSLQNDTTEIAIEQKGKFWEVTCPGLYTLKNCTYDTRTKVEKNLIKPNRIGTLAASKITMWVNYYINFYNQLKHIDTERIAAKKKWFEDAAHLPIQWNSTRTKGWFYKGGLKLTIEVTETGIDTDITVDASPKDLATFMLMADNKLVNKR